MVTQKNYLVWVLKYCLRSFNIVKFQQCTFWTMYSICIVILSKKKKKKNLQSVIFSFLVIKECKVTWDVIWKKKSSFWEIGCSDSFQNDYYY